MIILILFILLQIADGWTTHYAIASGKGQESNPVMKYLLSKFGYSALYASKVIVSVLAIWAYQKVSYIPFIIPTLYYLYIIYGNIKVSIGNK